MLPPTDTRFLFRPLTGEIMSMLRGLSPDDWERPTMAGRWRVRDVVAHLLDTALRRLSFQRDRRVPPSPAAPIATEQDLIAFVNDLNAMWIRSAERLSPRVLTDLYAGASSELADFVEHLSLDSPALFAVSWAGESTSAGWLDIGREFTEVWHHGAQIRAAVGAGPFTDPRWLGAVLEIALHALPHAYRDVPADRDAGLAIQITGPAGGSWTLRRSADRWDISPGTAHDAAARATMADDTAWRLLFNALPPSAAEPLVRLDGDARIGRPLLRVRSVIVTPLNP